MRAGIYPCWFYRRSHFAHPGLPSHRRITARDQAERLRRDWRDRFGQFPPAVDNLFLLTEIRLAAAEAGISRVEVREDKLMLTRRGDFILVGGKFPRLVAGRIEQRSEERREGKGVGKRSV